MKLIKNKLDEKREHCKEVILNALEEHQPDEVIIVCINSEEQRGYTSYSDTDNLPALIGMLELAKRDILI